MDALVADALRKDRLVDITTTGRRSGAPSRKEIVFHHLDGEIYLTGTPGRRDWYANMLANPAFTFHLKQSATADLAARAHPITSEQEKRLVLAEILPSMNRAHELEKWVAGSPLVRVEFLDQ